MGDCLLVALWVLWAASVAVNAITFLVPNPRKPVPSLRARPGVSILVPVKGVDFALGSNIERLFNLDYPSFEIVFLVADQGDPAIPLIEAAIAQNPTVAARLLVGDDTITINPKANNLIKGVDAARHDLLLMCDANVAITQTMLARMLAALTPDTGLVWAIPIAMQPANFPAELECAMDNGFGGRWLLAARFLGIGICVGKAMLARKRDLARLGGFKSLLAGGLVEDMTLAEGVHSLGLKTVAVDEIIEQPLGNRTFREFWDRHVRWHCYRRHHALLLSFIPEPLISAGGVTLVGALFWHLATGVRIWVAVLLLAGAWCLMEATYLWRLGWPLTWRAPAAWLVRELLLPLMWMQAAISHRVNWRGARVVVRRRRLKFAQLRTFPTVSATGAIDEP